MVGFGCTRKSPASTTVPWVSGFGLQAMVDFPCIRKLTATTSVPLTVMGEWLGFTKHGVFFFSVPENQLVPPLFLGQSWVSVFDLPAWWVFSVPENQLLSPLFLGESWVSVFDLPARWVFSVPENQLLSPFADSHGWLYTFTKHSVLSLYQKNNLCHHCSWHSHG